MVRAIREGGAHWWPLGRSPRGAKRGWKAGDSRLILKRKTSGRGKLYVRGVVTQPYFFTLAGAGAEVQTLPVADYIAGRRNGRIIGATWASLPGWVH